MPFHASETASAPVVGTISIAGPRVRFGPERYDELSHALHAAAAEITALWPIRTRQRRNDDGGSRTADAMEMQAS